MRLLLGILLVTTFVFAKADSALDKDYDSDGLVIHKTQEFVASTAPDELFTKVILDVDGKDYAKTSNTLYNLANSLKKYENICKNSGYTINKTFKWDSKKRVNVFTGYKGVLDIQCYYDKSSQIEKFFNDAVFKKLVDENKNVKISYSNTKWIVSKKTITETKENLETKAILYADTFANKTSRLLKRKCVANEINLLANPSRFIPLASQRGAMLRTASYDMIKSQEPSKKNIDLNYISNYTLFCEE